LEKETVVELKMDQPPTSIPALVAQHAASHGGDIILRTKDRGIWKALTWSALDARVRGIGTALLEAGFGRGDVVAILSESRPEAVYADLAILGCGAASVAIEPDDGPDRVCHQLSSSGSRLAFVENEEQLDKVLSVRDRCPALSRIVVFDMKGLRDFADASCVALSSFAGVGDSGAWAVATTSVEPDQPAVIQFPRGEGSGLGRSLTHGDLMHMVGAARARLPIHASDDRLAVSRLADITERVWGLYLALETRCVSNYPERADTAIENLRELQPTVFGADAAVWDRLQTLASARGKAATATQRLAYEWALRAGRVGGPKGQLADLLVLRAVRREFGLNKLRLAYVGGEAVAPAALDWARSLGIAIQRVDEAGLGADQLDERYQVLMQSAYAWPV
jgi:long-chain acyl-CoA synthetase